MAIHITWLGHSAFLINIDGQKIVIDPFLTGNPLATTKPEEIDANFVLLSHGHGDHIGDAPAIVKRTGATVVSNFEIGSWMQEKHGAQKVHTLNTGGGVELSFGRVELTPAIHSSALPDGDDGGLPNGFLIITKDGKKIYHAGDTAVFSDMQLIGARGLDLAMLPIGDYFTMGIAGSLQAIALLRPKAVIPMHYNTFPPIMQDVAGWAQQVHNTTDTKPIVLDPGGSYQL